MIVVAIAVGKPSASVGYVTTRCDGSGLHMHMSSSNFIYSENSFVSIGSGDLPASQSMSNGKQVI